MNKSLCMKAFQAANRLISETYKDVERFTFYEHLAGEESCSGYMMLVAFNGTGQFPKYKIDEDLSYQRKLDDWLPRGKIIPPEAFMEIVNFINHKHLNDQEYQISRDDLLKLLVRSQIYLEKNIWVVRALKYKFSEDNENLDFKLKKEDKYFVLVFQIFQMKEVHD